jgi:NAD(P)-dependent dehydrogenase (short-subunit alcohol dehydrogenase family)
MYTVAVMSENLTGKRILVVGGARGIGAEIVRRTGQAGADVVVATRSGPEVQIDVTDETTIARAAESLGAFDHVISTASAHHDVPVPDLEHDKIEAAFSAKVVGPLLLAKHFAPRMPADGSFLFFSGIVGWQPKPGTVVKGTGSCTSRSKATPPQNYNPNQGWRKSTREHLMRARATRGDSGVTTDTLGDA